MNVSRISGAGQYFNGFSKTMKSSVGAWSSIIFATSVGALATMAYYHWTQKTAPIHKGDVLSTKVHDRISRTYAYIFGGFAITAAAAIATHVSGLSLAILKNSYFAVPVIAILSGVALWKTIAIDKEDVKAKHIAWAIFNVSMGMMLSPIGFLDKALIVQAATISLGMGGLLFLGAYLAPSKSFLTWKSPIFTALSTISIASFISLFFPRSAFAYGIDRVSLYGGLLLYSGLMMANTQELVKEAEEQSDAIFDPLASSMNLYLNSLNIFLRILQILTEEKYKEKKE